MLVAVLLGVVLGSPAQTVYGLGSPAITGTMPWVGVVGGIYVRLLQMVIAPLVLVSILAAVTKLNDARSLGKISAGVLGMLLATTAVASVIGVVDGADLRPARRRPGAGRTRARDAALAMEGADRRSPAR